MSLGSNLNASKISGNLTARGVDISASPQKIDDVPKNVTDYYKSRYLLAQDNSGSGVTSSQSTKRITIVQGVAVRRITTIQTITTTIGRKPTEIRLQEGYRNYLLTVYIDPKEYNSVQKFELEISTVGKGFDIRGQTPRQRLRPVTVKPCGKKIGKKLIPGRWNGNQFVKGASCDVTYTAVWRRETRQIYRINTDGDQRSIYLTPKVVPAR